MTEGAAVEDPEVATRDPDRLDRLLRGLTAPQSDAVTTDDAPLCLVAGAGSGKTTVLTRRVARRVLDGSARADHTHVLTFTRKAAGELRHRLARLGVPGRVWAGTFHAAAYSQLRQSWNDRDIRQPALLDDPQRLLREILDGKRGRRVRGRPDPPAEDLLGAIVSVADLRSGARPLRSAGLPAVLAGEIHWAQVRLLAPDDYADAACAAGRLVPLAPERVAECYALFREEKRRRGLLDLDDLLDHCARLLEADGEAAAGQHWRIRHLFVDEFQDLNPAQWRLLRAWLGSRDDLFVVGDPRQAVYGWNGADPTLLERLPDLLPGIRVLHLDENHRSSPQIVAAARAVLGSEDGSGMRSDDLEDAPPDGPAPALRGFEDEEAEALAVSRWLRQAHRPGSSWSSLAVLARTNSRLGPVANVLRRSAIPCRITTSTAHAPGSDLHIPGQALALLRAQPTERALRGALAELTVGPDEDGDLVEAHGDLPTGGKASRLLAPELARLADEHTSEEPRATVGTFLTWLAANDAGPDAGDNSDHGNGTPQIDAVELTTFHRAKGLQWRAVAVVGLEHGIVPIAYATTSEALAEERRLLYVAMTRAEEELWCSWARSRDVQGRTWSCDRSPFLDAVEDAIHVAQTDGDVELSRARVEELRTRLPAAG